MPDIKFFNTIEPLSLDEIASITGCTIHAGSIKSDRKIKGVAPIDSATPDDLTFLSNKKYAPSLMASKAAACILEESSVSKAPEGMILFISNNPYAAYAKIATSLHPDDIGSEEISSQANIAKSAKIGKNCTIEAGVFIGENASIGNNAYLASGCYIGKGVQIGDNCRIAHSATITHAIIGNNVILHPGVKIGQDGFGFANERGIHLKVPQLGRVLIKDYVEIGANTCIDRGAGPDTIIGEGTKIDNLVQIGHNVQTGRGCIIVSQVGISGSTKLGDYVVVGGQVGIAGHLQIGSMVNIAAQSGVMHSIDDRQIIGGSPAIPVKQWHRQTIALKKLTAGKDKKED